MVEADNKPAFGEQMTVAAVDLPTLLKGVPEGDWVAISFDMERVVAHGHDMQKVLDEAQRLGENRPVITRVPDPSVALIL